MFSYLLSFQLVDDDVLFLAAPEINDYPSEGDQTKSGYNSPVCGCHFKFLERRDAKRIPLMRWSPA